MDTKRMITIYTSSLSFAKMKQGMPSRWSITAIKRLFITECHWIFVEKMLYWLNKKQESGEICNDNFDMGSGQSVYLVVKMWRDIPPAKLKVKNDNENLNPIIF